MTKANVYRKGIEKITERTGRFEDEEHYMSDMKNWICVHVTSYAPERNKSGKYFIKTTSMATNYDYARATVHMTLNNVVGNHLAGNWDDASFVILAPYNDIVKENGNPQEVAVDDTYFIPNPDTGLVLPKNTYIVKPDNGSLFNLGKGIATYKTDNFTDEEKEIILSHVTQYEKQKYEKTTLEKDKQSMLAVFLRNMVVRMVMAEMGYRYTNAFQNCITKKVAEVAEKNGARGNSSNTGHSASIEYDMEKTGQSILGLLCYMETEEDIGNIYKAILGTHYSHVENAFVESIVSDTPIDVYKIYENQLKDNIETKKLMANIKSEENEKAKYLKEIAILEQKGIVGYNQNLDIVLHRNAKKLVQKYSNVIKKLKQNSQYSLLKQMLTDFMKTGEKWVKVQGCWQPKKDPSNSTLPKNFRIRGLSL
jgi:hypothetical protein